LVPSLWLHWEILETLSNRWGLVGVCRSLGMFPQKILWHPSLRFSFSYLPAMKWTTLLHQVLHTFMYCLAAGPEKTGPNTHGLTSETMIQAKPCLSYMLITSSICYSNRKLTHHKTTSFLERFSLAMGEERLIP
jgi:hypothetical protein